MTVRVQNAISGRKIEIPRVKTNFFFDWQGIEGFEANTL